MKLAMLVGTLLICLCCMACDGIIQAEETPTTEPYTTIIQAEETPTTELHTTINLEVGWELLGEFVRDVRQPHWHDFFLTPDEKDRILDAHEEGRSFIFTLQKEIQNHINPIYFYFLQPQKIWDPDADVRDKHARYKGSWTMLYFPYPPGRWYTHWGPDTNRLGDKIDRDESGFFAEFDLGFRKEDNTWEGGSVKFGTTREGWRTRTSFIPHIDDDYTLRVYASIPCE